jgi:hypothetical protein
MLGVTTFLTTDVTPVPMLWVIPLSLYLLSFILVFSPLPGWIHQAMIWALPVVVLWQTYLSDPGNPNTLASLGPAHLATFFIAAMICHGELARRRPTPEQLTEFYLWMSLGGVLGGLFNALIAPLIFNRVIEYPLAIVFAVALSPSPRSGSWKKRGTGEIVNTRSSGRFNPRDLLWPVVVTLVAGLVYFYWPIDDQDQRDRSRHDETLKCLRAALALAPCAAWIRRPIAFALCIAGVLCVMASFYDVTSHTVFRERSFYGVLKVTQDMDPPVNYLMHGHIRHGAQLRDDDPSVRDQPLTYFHRSGPIGQMFLALNDRLVGKKLAVVGLGVGSLAAYGQAGQRLTFFEIDPAVRRVARDPRYFTFLRDTPAEVRVVLGDARLCLAREEDGAFALIVIDAFSGDAVPVHLLTREAMAQYRAKLAPGGMMAFHISSIYLRLDAVLGNLARAEGLVGLEQNDEYDVPASNSQAAPKMASHWVLVAVDRADFGPLASDERWHVLGPDENVSLWTDDFSNLPEVVQWPRGGR